ncbi:MAG TPA: ABC transporter permease subunit [Candidatus Acidoferrum sp.]|nr:ABC transporter permease subunit [Candidatus Acidoferrum sp.]
MRSYWVQRGVVTLAQVAAVVLFLVLWQQAADHKVIDSFFYSNPHDIWDQIRAWYDAGTLAGDVGATLFVLGVGYVAGVVVGVVIGVLTGAFQWVGELLDPFLVFFNAVPRLMVMPIFIVWFGFGYRPQIYLVVTVIVFQIAVNVQAGLREVKSELLQNVRVMGASRLDQIRHVYVPSIAIWITATARVTVGFAFQAAIAAQFLGASKGLGYQVVLGQGTQKVQAIFAAMLIMVVVAVVIDAVLAAVERRATRWMPRVGT